MRSQGDGALVLLAGEAGIGKTRLAEEVAGGGRCAGAARRREPGGGAALRRRCWAPCAAICAQRRVALASCGPLQGHLALLLPELGPAVAESDRATLFEALRCALATIAAGSPAVILLDDLQWSDDATLELLGALPIPCASCRSSSWAPTAPTRSRARIRCAACATSCAAPARCASSRSSRSMPTGTARAGRARSSARRRRPRSRARCYDRTQGVPFFVEELAGALESGGRLTAGARGLELAGNGEIPVPETIRDAVLLRAAGLSDAARAAAEAASVGRPALRPRARGRARRRRRARASCSPAGSWPRPSPARGSFRHALARDAIYEDVPWPRRRALHRRLAEALEARGGPGVEVASHWLAAREGPRALDALLRAARRAAGAARLSRRGPCGAARARAVARRRARGRAHRAARALRAQRGARRRPDRGHARVARGGRGAPRGRASGARWPTPSATWPRSTSCAATASAPSPRGAWRPIRSPTNGLPGEAAAERLVVAGYLQSAGKHGEAAALARAAGRRPSAPSASTCAPAPWD